MPDESLLLRDARLDVPVLLGAVLRRLPRIALVTLALLAATFVVLLLQPRLYESSATLLIGPGAPAAMLSEQVAAIQSRDTLLQAVDQLDLRSKAEFNGGQAGFSPLGVLMQVMGRRAAPTSIDEIVLTTLRERLTVTAEGASNRIAVAVRATEPQLAADIANAIAEAQAARRALLPLPTAEMSDEQRAEIEQLRAAVAAAETALAQFRADNDAVGEDTADPQLADLASQLSAARERQHAAQARATLIRGLLERNQPIEGVPEVRDSAAVQQLSAERARLQGEKAQHSATLLANHPTIRTLTAQIAELDGQIAAEGRRIAAALDAEAQIEAEMASALDQQLAEAQTGAALPADAAATLARLQGEVETQRGRLDAYLARLGETAAPPALGTLPAVTVVALATPATTPVSPQTALILIVVGLLALAGQLGAVTMVEILSGRARFVPVPPQDELGPAPFHVDELDAEIVELPVAPADSAPLAEGLPVEVPPVEMPVDAAEPDEPEQVRAFIQELASEAVEEEAPVAPAEPPVAAIAMGAAPGVVRYSDLAADLVLGRTHLLLLAELDRETPGRAFAEDLVSEALAKGLSVALVDAGSGRRGAVAGLTELSTGAASFGDVVQKSADNSYAEVAWGQGATLDRDSAKPLTLVEALGDLYEVVVVLTGRLDRRSTLAGFLALNGRVVLVAGPDADMDVAAATRLRLMEAGVPLVEIATSRAAVAA